MVNTRDLFKRLASQEEEFLHREFMAPIVPGKPVRVRVSNIVLTLQVDDDKQHPGKWGILRPTGHKTATVLRDATLIERQHYLALFPAVRMILSARRGKQWYGIAGSLGDSRFKFSGLCPVLLPFEPQMFDSVIARFDGKNFWYDQIAPYHSPQVSLALRERLANSGEPRYFDIPGLTEEERQAYKLAYSEQVERHRAKTKNVPEERIKDALWRGGAQYRGHVERGEHYTVEYVVDGQTHRSTVSKDTLRVESAGICLTDHDTGRVGDMDFDLQSLVGVIREGQNDGMV